MRRDTRMPEWAQRLLEGELPAGETPERGEFIRWRYFDDAVVGLPSSQSDEGMALVAAAREPAGAD